MSTHTSILLTLSSQYIGTARLVSSEATCRESGQTGWTPPGTDCFTAGRGMADLYYRVRRRGGGGLRCQVPASEC